MLEDWGAVERHGEMGTLFSPKIQLTDEEFRLLCEFKQAAPEHITKRSDEVALFRTRPRTLPSSPTPRSPRL